MWQADIDHIPYENEENTDVGKNTRISIEDSPYSHLSNFISSYEYASGDVSMTFYEVELSQDFSPFSKGDIVYFACFNFMKGIVIMRGHADITMREQYKKIGREINSMKSNILMMRSKELSDHYKDLRELSKKCVYINVPFSIIKI